MRKIKYVRKIVKKRTYLFFLSLNKYNPIAEIKRCYLICRDENCKNFVNNLLSAICVSISLSAANDKLKVSSVYFENCCCAFCVFRK